MVLDSAVTEELEAEGWAKDRIRELQDARRAAGSRGVRPDHVVLEVPAERRDWARAHRELIAGEILAVELELAEAPGDAVELGEGVRAAIAKA